MILGGETITTPAENFQNYVIRITRKDLRTGDSLTAAGWMLMRPFKPGVVDPKTPHPSRNVEGAADGSESSLPSPL